MDKRKKLVAAIAAMTLAATAFAAGFPAYLEVDGTTIVDYSNDVPANLVIPNGITEIWENAFKNCAAIRSVTIPSGVKKIGSFAFKGCTSLTTVTIENGVREIGNFAFSGCESLMRVIIPGSVTKVTWGVFYDCPNLKEVRYGGTKAQWRAFGDLGLESGSIVRCTDGDITAK